MRNVRRIIFYLFVIGLIASTIAYFVIYPEKFDRLKRDFTQNAFVQKVVDVAANTPGPLRFLGESTSSHLDVSLIIAETNKRRSDNGASTLTENAALTRAAEMKLKDMADNQYFEHVSPSGKGPSDLAKAAGYSYVLVGENLAMGNFENDSVLLDAWMNSPGHRANILNSRYKEIGVAAAKVTYEGRSTWLAVQEFGKPASDCAVANEALKARIDVQETALRSLESALSSRKADLESRHPRTQEERKAYNDDVAEYNSLLEKYKADAATLQKDIAEYNVQIRAYNACINS